jgi:hypothetical protein
MTARHYVRPGTIDGARTDGLIAMLRLTPENTDILLVRIGEEDSEDWAQNLRTIEQVLGRDVNYLDNPLPKSRSIKQAHDSGRSVWSLQRTAVTIDFLRRTM